MQSPKAAPLEGAAFSFTGSIYVAQSPPRNLNWHSMKFALALIAFVVAALVFPFFLSDVGKREGVDPNANLPWQITADGNGGSTVFGLQPGASTMGDVRRQLGRDVDVAIVAAPGESGSVEGYYSQVALGFVLAKVIVTVDAEKGQILEMRGRALSEKPMESTTRKYKLQPEDLGRIDSLPIRAISVIPTVNLDEVTILQRFGTPQERIRIADHRTHLLYPQLGLDVLVDGEGKELLQYVAPREFASLREPLQMMAAEGGRR